MIEDTRNIYLISLEGFANCPSPKQVSFHNMKMYTVLKILIQKYQKFQK